MTATRECPRCGGSMIRLGKRDSCRECGTRTPVSGQHMAEVNGLCDYLRKHFIDFDIQFDTGIYPIVVRIQA